MGSEVKVISFEGATARYKQRADGLWVIDWREAGKGRSTTAVSEVKAMARAKKAVKQIANSSGGALMTHEDVELVKLVKRLSGDSSPFVWLRQIDDILQRLKGKVKLREVVDHYEQAGLLKVERILFDDARKTFQTRYKSNGWTTIATMRKALADFEERYPKVMVTDITIPMLLSRLERNKPSPKTFNNRLGYWKTFFNVCREMGYLPAGEKHVAELVKKRKESDRIPAIFTVDQAKSALGVIERKHLPCFVIGCWLGARPQSEMRQLDWTMFDWERNYLHISDKVAGKTMRERFVPIPANVVEMLKPWKDKTGKCIGKADVENLSLKLREKGIIDRWVPDVMRHSSISYSIASGKSIGRVAEEHGNSETIIRKKYRRPLRKEDGDAWYQVGLKLNE